jgi:inner membrane protein
MGEYWVTGVIVVMCISVGVMTRHFDGGAYTPFFWDYPDYYHQGLIDGAEWKENRFRWL